MYPNLNDLHYFVEIAHTKNLSQAAIRLGMTQPSLSAAVQRLEHSLGQRLFHRSKKGVGLTPSGRELLIYARQLIQDWESVVSKTTSSKDEVKGKFILGCHPSVGLYTLPQVFATWMSQFPGLELKLVHDLSRKVLEHVISMEVDLGIVINPVKHPDLVLKKVGEDRVTFWAAQGLKSNKDVLIGDPSLMQTQDLLKKIKKTRFQFTRFISSSNLELIASLVSSGAGIGVLPGRVAQRLGHLVALKEVPSFKDEIYTAYRSELRQIKAIQVLSKEIEDALGA